MARDESRGAWTSKLGFILAASGSAIGLGNIVFFSSNAYQYGGGAFYLPYFVALFMLGIPVMILKFGIGTMTGRTLPGALRELAGRKGEFVGWWSLANTSIITMYYNTILAWALAMMFGAVGTLFEPGASAPFAPFAAPADGPSAVAYFFGIVSSAWPILAVLAIWAANLLILARGVGSIEKAVRIFVPLMWVFMIGLVIRGLTLDGGLDGVLYLFTPDLKGIAEPQVWRGAFSQMFFSLSLGLGAMTAYASYLPKDSDHVNNSMMVSFLNCGFEYIAGIAIFALLFAFSLNPAGGTLTLSFFVIPQGIASLPWGVKVIGFLFFLLLVLAGLSSSVSLIESQASALIDELGLSRPRALTLVSLPGLIGSLLFALPKVIDQGLAGNGTLGLTLLDVTDHWAFGYSLLLAGLFACLLVGWVLGADRLRQAVNVHSALPLGRWYNGMVRYVAPLLLGSVIAWSLYDEFTSGTIYGAGDHLGGFSWIPYIIPALWVGGTLAIASVLTFRSASARAVVRGDTATDVAGSSIQTSV